MCFILYKLYFRDSLGNVLNEEPLVSSDRPVVGEVFCLSMRQNSISLRVLDTERIFGSDDLSNGYSYYVTVGFKKDSNNTLKSFSPSQVYGIKRDISGINNPIPELTFDEFVEANKSAKMGIECNALSCGEEVSGVDILASIHPVDETEGGQKYISANSPLLSISYTVGDIKSKSDTVTYDKEVFVDWLVKRVLDKKLYVNNVDFLKRYVGMYFVEKHTHSI